MCCVYWATFTWVFYGHYTLLTYIHHWCVPTVPTALSSCNINLLYNQVSKRLLFINSSWNSIPVSRITSNDKLYCLCYCQVNKCSTYHKFKDRDRHAWAWELLLFACICKWHWATDSAHLFVDILNNRFLSNRSEGLVCTYVYIKQKVFCQVF